jgi:hypothetical protein
MKIPLCRKRKFDRIGAILALAKAEKARSIYRLECRAYELRNAGKTSII